VNRTPFAPATAASTSGDTAASSPNTNTITFGTIEAPFFKRSLQSLLDEAPGQVY
jgi:hypothetical protein